MQLWLVSQIQLNAEPMTKLAANKLTNKGNKEEVVDIQLTHFRAISHTRTLFRQKICSTTFSTVLTYHVAIEVELEGDLSSNITIDKNKK